MTAFGQLLQRNGSGGSIKQYLGYALFCIIIGLFVGIMFNFETLKKLNL